MFSDCLGYRQLRHQSRQLLGFESLRLEFGAPSELCREEAGSGAGFGEPLERHRNHQNQKWTSEHSINMGDIGA